MQPNPIKMSMLPPDPIYIFKGEMLAISCIAFKITDSTQRIYAGTLSGVVHVWYLKSKREVGSFKAGNSTCLSLCILPEEDIIITLTKSGEVTSWKENDNDWVQKKTIKIDFFGFCKCQLLDSTLYIPLKDSKCELILVKSMETLKTITLGNNGFGDLMAFKVFDINSRKIMLVAYEGLKLALWDLSESKKVSSFELDECPMTADYDVVTNKGLCGGPSEKITVFSLEKNLDFKMIKSVMLPNAGAAAVRIRPDGKLVAVGCWDGKLRLYSWKRLTLLAALDIHSATIQDVSFSENYKEGLKIRYLLAAGSQDCKISLWDLYN